MPTAIVARSGHGGGQIPGPHGPMGGPSCTREFHPLGQRWESASPQAGELIIGGDHHLDEFSLGPSNPSLLQAYLFASELRVSLNCWVRLSEEAMAELLLWEQLPRL